MFDSIQLIDGLHMYQDHEIELPVLGDTRQYIVDVQTGDVISDRQHLLLLKAHILQALRSISQVVESQFPVETLLK